MPIYKLRYGILRSIDIFNECGPYSGGPAGWDEDSIEKRKIQGDRHIANTNEQTGFFDNIEKSILKDGFRNPILVSAGFCPRISDHGKNPRLPLEMQEDHSKILVCNANGGSRLWVAQTHNLEIPCLISDFDDIYPDMKTIESRNIQEVRDCYDKNDQPHNIWFRKHGLQIRFTPR